MLRQVLRSGFESPTPHASFAQKSTAKGGCNLKRVFRGLKRDGFIDGIVAMRRNHPQNAGQKACRSLKGSCNLRLSEIPSMCFLCLSDSSGPSQVLKIAAFLVQECWCIGVHVIGRLISLKLAVVFGSVGRCKVRWALKHELFFGSLAACRGLELRPITGLSSGIRLATAPWVVQDPLTQLASPHHTGTGPIPKTVSMELNRFPIAPCSWP